MVGQNTKRMEGCLVACFDYQYLANLDDITKKSGPNEKAVIMFMGTNLWGTGSNW